jgi:hypothetical protein
MANLNLSQFGEKLFVADADHTFIWDSAASISKRVSRNSWLSGTTADFHLGLADAASPVAQTISVQSVVAGTSNTAGANLSINGSQGTGTGAGGSLLLRTAPAGSSGTAQNALATAVAITSAGNVGIGTTSPTSKLHVVGDAVLTGQLLGSDYTVGTLTASPQPCVSFSNNHAAFANSSIVISTKGTGAFILGPKPDGLVAGGNVRGIYSVDLQIARTVANQVASGALSTIAGGQNNKAAGDWTFVGGGVSNTASGSASVVSGGSSCTASGAQSAAAGLRNQATSDYSFIAGGSDALANRVGLSAHAAGLFVVPGDAQKTTAVFRNKTTTNTAVELFLDGASARYTVTSGKIISMLINITGTKSDGSAVAHYVRQYSIKNIGGTTSEVYAAVTVGTDNAAGTSIALSANDTNDALKIEVTGVASETWRWVASVDAVEVGHGT